MLKLDLYDKKYAKQILSWSDNSTDFYKWTAGVLGDYPISEEQFNQVMKHRAFVCLNGDDIVGFFTLRKPDNSVDEFRIGFVIIAPDKRRLGFGKKMLKLGIEYAFHNLDAKRLSLAVFENNEAAYYCYKSVGFSDVTSDDVETYQVLGEEWKCRELELQTDY